MSSGDNTIIAIISVCQFCLDELTVQAGDVGDGLVLRTNSLAGTCVGAVAEAKLLHLHDHCLSALSCLGTALRKQCELTYLRTYEQHS